MERETLGLSDTKLHHVGIVSPSEKLAVQQMAFLGFKESFRGYVKTWNALCIFCAPNGAVPLEFVIADREPLTKFNDGIGGVHHIALQVNDIDATMRQLSQKGIKLLEPEPVKGAGPFLCNFVHPIYTKGIIVEIVQEI